MSLSFDVQQFFGFISHLRSEKKRDHDQHKTLILDCLVLEPFKCSNTFQVLL